MIEDDRQEDAFRQTTFSGHRKTEVRKELVKAMRDSRHETACHWAAELVCSGDIESILPAAIEVYSRHIHTGNPRLALYLASAIRRYTDLLAADPFKIMIHLRNNTAIRELICELVVVLCEAPKHHELVDAPFNPARDLDLTDEAGSRCRATGLEFAEHLFAEGDCPDLFIPINELAFCLATRAPVQDACFWIDWVLAYEALCRSQHAPCTIKPRYNSSVSVKQQSHPVWMLWELFNRSAADRGGQMPELVSALCTLYAYEFTVTASRKRRPILYMCVTLLTCPVQMPNQVIFGKQVIRDAVANIGIIYSRIKEKEQCAVSAALLTGDGLTPEERAARAAAVEAIARPTYNPHVLF